MNRRLLYPILILAVSAYFYFIKESEDKNSIRNSEFNEGSSGHYSEFDASFLPNSTTGQIIHHNYYSLSYSEHDEQAEWVAYELKKSDLSNRVYDRPYFEEDKAVTTKSADWRNYRNSGYDRGHLCPAGDRKFSEFAYNETFLTSNISPQNREFNTGIWNRLEQKVRYWAKKHDGVYVVTGGILKPGLKFIGSEKVSVPEEYYKIIVDLSNGNHKAIGFLMPNENSEYSLFEYAVPIEVIEKKTGIDFFYQLPTSVQKSMETGVDLKFWQ